LRVLARGSVEALERLAKNESLRTHDPEVQMRARERSGVQVTVFGMEADCTVPVRLYSAVEQREKLVGSRQGNCLPCKVCRIGENAVSIGKQADVFISQATLWNSQRMRQ
jgi:hypothetical protein